MVDVPNHGGGVDSGGMAEELGIYGRSLVSWTCGSRNIGGLTRLPQLLNGAAAALPDLHRLLTKSLCTLQALVSNMEESGEEHVAREIYESQFADEWQGGDGVEAALFRQSAQAAITAVLGTFDLEALKTLVGEIDDVLGGEK
jgi:hypothetical protein